MCQGTSFFRVLAEQKNNTIEKERRQYMQYGGRDSKTMKGKLLTGVGLLLISGGCVGVIMGTGAFDEMVNWALYKLQDKGINVLVPVVFFIYCFIGAFASGDQIIAMVPVGLMFAKKLRLDPIIGMSIVILAYFVGGLSSPTGAMLPHASTMGLDSIPASLYGLSSSWCSAPLPCCLYCGMPSGLPRTPETL